MSTTIIQKYQNLKIFINAKMLIPHIIIIHNVLLQPSVP